jgi:hypothetical protein
MNGDRRYFSLRHRDAELVKARRNIPNRIQPRNAGRRMLINLDQPILIKFGTEALSQLRSWSNSQS